MGGLRKIDGGGVSGDGIPELLGEAEDADGGLEEVGGVVEVGELEGFGADLEVGERDVRADGFEGGLEGGERRSEGGERGMGMVEGGELGEEMVVTGEDL